MLVEQNFLRDLKRDMAKLAHETLLNTADPQELTRAAGRYQGMSHALQLFEKFLRAASEE